MFRKRVKAPQWRPFAPGVPLTGRHERNDLHVARQLRLLLVPEHDDVSGAVQREHGLHQGDATWQRIEAVFEARDDPKEALARAARGP